MYQPELFERSQTEMLWDEIKKLTNMIRGLYARNHELEKNGMQMQIKITELLSKINEEQMHLNM